MSEDAGNIITFGTMEKRASASKALEIHNKQESRSCSPQCMSLAVDKHKRTVECDRCGKVIDPFDYMLRIAQKGEHKLIILEEIQRKISAGRKEEEDLNRRLNNLRAALKRRRAPQSAKDRMEFNMARWNAGYEPKVETPENP